MFIQKTKQLKTKSLCESLFVEFDATVTLLFSYSVCLPFFCRRLRGCLADCWCEPTSSRLSSAFHGANASSIIIPSQHQRESFRLFVCLFVFKHTVLCNGIQYEIRFYANCTLKAQVIYLRFVCARPQIKTNTHTHTQTVCTFGCDSNRKWYWPNNWARELCWRWIAWRSQVRASLQVSWYAPLSVSLSHACHSICTLAAVPNEITLAFSLTINNSGFDCPLLHIYNNESHGAKKKIAVQNWIVVVAIIKIDLFGNWSEFVSRIRWWPQEKPKKKNFQ